MPQISEEGGTDVYKRQAQGGACFAVWFKTKDAKIKAITLPSAFSAMLGITEAAIFGINPVSYTHLDVYKRQ